MMRVLVTHQVAGRFHSLKVLPQTENTGELSDGEAFDSLFLLTEEMIGESRNVASVTIEVSCNDNDDVGFNDGGSGESDLAGVSGELKINQDQEIVEEVMPSL